MAEEYNLIEERKRAEEQRKKDREEFEKRLNDLAARRDERMPSVDQIFLNENQIKDYQSRLTTNLDKREELRDYLLGLLFKSQKTQDPEVDPTTGDVTYTEGRRIKPITANTLANEAKQEDRVGKSKIGNFFRNIDYSLSDYKTRDMGVGANQQRQAMQLLDNLLKDQGTEIGRSINTQNTFAAKNAQINQKTDKDAADVALRTRALDQKDVAQGFGDVLRGMQIQGVQDMNKKKGALIDSQTEGQNLRNKFFAPYGSREYQDAYQMEKAANGGKDPDPEKVQERINKTLLMKGIISRGARGNESTTRTGVTWGIDANNQKVPLPTTSTSTKANPYAAVFDDMVAKSGLLGGGQGSSSNSPVRQQLAQAAVQSRPEMRAPGIVNEAIKNTQDKNTRVAQATEALNLNLPPAQIKEDERRRRLGYRYTIDRNPNSPKGKDGVFASGGGIKDTNLSSNLRTKLNTGSHFMLEAGATGVLDKALGAGNNPIAADQKVGESFLPNFLTEKMAPQSANPDVALRRLFPGIDQDADTREFKVRFTQLMDGLGFDIQKDATGLQALGQEMERIKGMLPQTTDAPTIALSAMLTLATQKLVEGHLIRKGYSPDDAEEVARLSGDYIAPRVSYLKDKVSATKKDLRAMYANGSIPPDAANKKFSVADLDPDDIIGEALSIKGRNFGDIPIKIRKLIPDGDLEKMRKTNKGAEKALIEEEARKKKASALPTNSPELIKSLMEKFGIMLAK